MTNYYRCFVPGYAAIAVPLNDPTRKYSPSRMERTQEQKDAFEQLKTVLTSLRVLTSSDESKPFTLHTDASSIGIGAIFSRMPKEQTNPLLASQVTEQECLAVVEAVRHFLVYLSRRPFTVITDHHNLVYLNAMMDENGWLTHWALAHQSYLIEGQHQQE